MENTRQRKHLYKQAGIWLVALFVVLTAAFMRGKVNVKAAETDDITITRYVDGREQTDSWTGGEWEYTVGDSINLSVKVEGISDTTNLKYKWRYAGKVVSESTGGTESSVTITKECGEDSPDCVISNGDEEIDTVWFTLETTETLEVFRPTLFIDGEKAPETTEDDGNSEYSWDDSINLQLGQELKIKLNVESSYDAKNISYEWYQQDEDGWYNDKISDENGGNTDAVTVKKQKYGKERYRCEVTDGNQKEDLYITIPEVKTLSVIKKVNGEVYKSGMEGIRGKKYTLKVDAESVYKDENGKTYWYDFGRDQTKDKKPGSVFIKSVRKGEINWAVITVILRVKDQDSYGSGKTINIPSPYGDSFTYMGWSLITSTGSNQYKLRVKTGEHYDANGFGKIGDRYVIACTPTFGKIGDEIDFVLANGRVIHGVMGDEKNMSDAGCNKWGHDGGHSVVEFVVNKSMWYHTGKTVTRFHPEWAKSRVVKAVNLGKNHLR